MKTRINGIEREISDAQGAVKKETKSTAGDKHETGRAMAQLETERLGKQLQDALQLEKVMHRIDPSAECQKAQLGALVISDNGSFYLAIGIGIEQILEHQITIISPGSPLGKILLGSQKGDEICFNGNAYRVKLVC